MLQSDFATAQMYFTKLILSCKMVIVLTFDILKLRALMTLHPVIIYYSNWLACLHEIEAGNTRYMVTLKEYIDYVIC